MAGALSAAMAFSFEGAAIWACGADGPTAVSFSEGGPAAPSAASAPPWCVTSLAPRSLTLKLPSQRIFAGGPAGLQTATPGTGASSSIRRASFSYRCRASASTSGPTAPAAATNGAW